MKRKQGYSLAVLFFIVEIATIPLPAQILPETTTDYLGYYQLQGHTSAYQTVITQNGGKVVNLQADTSFFVLWVPANYATLKDKRAMLCIHGTAGTGYDEVRDELANAKANGFALVAIQWAYFTAPTERYFSEDKVYRLIDTALKHMKAKYGVETNKTAYRGFSRGGLISYEVAYLDRAKGTNYFALTLALSGGQSPSFTPGKYDRTAFMDKLERGEYGAKPFLGASFFLYCGLKDEQWDTLQAKYMRHTDSTVRKYGANVARLVIDPDGKHAGFQASAGYQASALQYFFALTSAPVPPALIAPSDKATGQPTALTLQWATSATASLFDVQVSVNADFSTTFARDSLISANSPLKSLAGLSPAATYYWRVRSKNNTGASVWSEARSFTTSIGTSVAEVPDESFTVAPNPAHDFVSVRFRLEHTETVRLALYDVLGREAALLLDEKRAAGEQKAAIDLRELSLPRGVYFVRLQTPTFSIAKPVQILR